MSNLERCQEVIGEYLGRGKGHCGLYDSRSCVGDSKVTLYEDQDILIDYCPGWDYFEVFGLSNYEFSELFNWYHS